MTPPVLLQITRPAACTGVTEDGWLTYRPGDLIIRAYRTDDGRIVYRAEELP